MSRSEPVDFDLYISYVEELMEEPLVQGGNLRSQFSMHATQGQPVQFSSHEPNKTELKSFLVTFRHFVLKDGPMFVSKVANELWRLLEGDEARDYLKTVRAKYDTAVRTGNMAVVINNDSFTPEWVLDLWINGRYFHTEKRKREALDQLDPFSKMFIDNQMLDALIATTNYVTALASAIVWGRRAGLL